MAYCGLAVIPPLVIALLSKKVTLDNSQWLCVCRCAAMHGLEH